MVKVQVREKVAFDEFLAQYSDEDLWVELENGEVVVMSPASTLHQRIVGFLYRLLAYFVEKQALGEVIPAPFLMRLSPDTAREPDLLFVAREHLHRLKATYLDGPADLVVEVVSPESRVRDRGTKYAEYEMAGVREYWIVDPDLQRADFYVLAEDGRYERRRPDAEGWYTSVVLPGFRLYVPWLWQEPLPNLTDVLNRLGWR